MPSVGQRQAAILIWVAFGMGATLLTLVAIMPEVWNNSLAAHYESQLKSGTPEQQLEAVREASKLHESGLPVLVKAMNSTAPTVAEAARQAILNEMNSWELTPTTAYPKLTELARLLRQLGTDFQTPARNYASEIAQRIFMWPGLHQQPNHDSLAKTCTEIMSLAGNRPVSTNATDPYAEVYARTARSSGGQLPTFQPNTSGQNGYATNGYPANNAASNYAPARPSSVWPTNSYATNDPQSSRPTAGTTATRQGVRESAWSLTADDMVRLAQYPGGGLPFQAASPAPQHLATVPERQLTPPERQLTPFDSNANSGGSMQPVWPPVGNNAAARPNPTSVVAPTVTAPSATPPDTAQNPFANFASRTTSAPVAAATNQPAMLGVTNEASPFGNLSNVMKPLANPQSREADAARAELTRLGWTPQMLTFAQMLQSPDPTVRRQLAEALPKSSGVDVKPWLIALSQDPHADVRYTAAGIMATTTDPDLLRRVQELSRTDTDPRIASLGSRAKGPPTLPAAQR